MINKLLGGGDDVPLGDTGSKARVKSSSPELESLRSLAKTYEEYACPKTWAERHASSQVGLYAYAFTGHFPQITAPKHYRTALYRHFQQAGGLPQKLSETLLAIHPDYPGIIPVALKDVNRAHNAKLPYAPERGDMPFRLSSPNFHYAVTSFPKEHKDEKPDRALVMMDKNKDGLHVCITNFGLEPTGYTPEKLEYLKVDVRAHYFSFFKKINWYQYIPPEQAKGRPERLEKFEFNKLGMQGAQSCSFPEVPAGLDMALRQNYQWHHRDDYLWVFRNNHENILGYYDPGNDTYENAHQEYREYALGHHVRKHGLSAALEALEHKPRFF